MYKHILVPLDGSKFSQKALTSAIKIAKLTKARMTVFHVVSRVAPVMSADVYTPADASWIEKYERTARREGQKHLRKAVAAAQSAGIRCRSKTTSSDQPYRAIIAAARGGDCDLIVMASHGRHGLSALLLGSETSKVLTHCKRPVLVVR